MSNAINSSLCAATSPLPIKRPTARAHSVCATLTELLPDVIAPNEGDIPPVRRNP